MTDVVIIIRPHRITTYIDAAYCYRPSRVVCRSVTLVSPAKIAAPIEMPFGLWTWVGPRNHALDGRPDHPMERGKGASHCKAQGHSVLICAKTPSQMQIRLWAGIDRRNCVRWESSGAEGRCHGNQFWDTICYNWLFGYNFGCIIASDTLFDSRGGFSGWSYPMKT